MLGHMARKPESSTAFYKLEPDLTSYLFTSRISNPMCSMDGLHESSSETY